MGVDSEQVTSSPLRSVEVKPIMRAIMQLCERLRERSEFQVIRTPIPSLSAVVDERYDETVICLNKMPEKVRIVIISLFIARHFIHDSKPYSIRTVTRC